MSAKVYITTPIYRFPLWDFLKGCNNAINHAAQNGIACEFAHVYQAAMLTHSRATLLYNFMQSDATHMLHLDDDTEIPPHGITTLVNREKDLIGGIYRVRDNSGKLVLSLQKSQPTVKEFYEGLPGNGEEPVEVRFIGTGCLMVTREAVETMINEYPNLKYFDAAGDKVFKHALYQPIIDPIAGYFTEDQSFCFRASECGFKIYADPTVRCTHWGMAGFGI